MLLFNLTSALLLIVTIAFPIARRETMDEYRALGIQLPGLTEMLLNPTLPWLLLAVFIIRLWLHAVMRTRLPSKPEGTVVLISTIVFVLVTVFAFLMPLLVNHEDGIGPNT